MGTGFFPFVKAQSEAAHFNKNVANVGDLPVGELPNRRQRIRQALRMMCGGAVGGFFLGCFLGATVDIVLGGLQSAATTCPDGMFFGSALLAAVGAFAGLLFAWVPP